MIRKVKIADAQAIAHLSEVLGYLVSEAVVERNIARVLENPQHEFLVFDNGQQVVGFIEAETYEAVYSEEVMFNVLGLVVDETMQGQGIGAQLLTALEEKAKERKIRAIRLNSGSQRQGAHLFYEHQGYESNHSQKRFLKFL